jgi:hypothetical protein
MTLPLRFRSNGTEATVLSAQESLAWGAQRFRCVQVKSRTANGQGEGTGTVLQTIQVEGQEEKSNAGRILTCSWRESWAAGPGRLARREAGALLHGGQLRALHGVLPPRLPRGYKL